MQTSIEWLVTELNQELNYIPITQWDRIRDIIHKAKEMHKQEIMVAIQDGFNRFFRKGDRKEVSNEQYYQDTFKID